MTFFLKLSAPSRKWYLQLHIIIISSSSTISNIIGAAMESALTPALLCKDAVEMFMVECRTFTDTNPEGDTISLHKMSFILLLRQFIKLQQNIFLSDQANCSSQVRVSVSLFCLEIWTDTGQQKQFRNNKNNNNQLRLSLTAAVASNAN